MAVDEKLFLKRHVDKTKVFNVLLTLTEFMDLFFSFNDMAFKEATVKVQEC